MTTFPLITATGTELAAVANQRFAAVVSSFIDAGPAPGTAFDYAAFIYWGDNTDWSTGGISPLGGGRYDVAASHTYRSAGTYTAVVVIFDVRNISRYAVALTTVNVTGGGAPGGGSNPGGGWEADYLEALDGIYADPWKDRRPGQALFTTPLR